MLQKSLWKQKLRERKFIICFNLNTRNTQVHDTHLLPVVNPWIRVEEDSTTDEQFFGSTYLKKVHDYISRCTYLLAGKIKMK